MAPVIQTLGLTKHYGGHRGIEQVEFEVAAGEVFGFLGPNGAGKTTTIRILLDTVRATAGTARIFGLDSRSDSVAIHRRVGYLPGEFSLYDRLTGRETVDYFSKLHGGVDRAYQAQLAERLDVDLSRRYRDYSRGNKQKVALITALQHRPDLLVLDEPSSGLDPLGQQTFLALLREAREDGRTVFLSSHVLDEVRRSCDRVGIIREGRLETVAPVDQLRDMAHHEVELRFAGAVTAAEFESLPGVSIVTATDHELHLTVTGEMDPVVRAAARHHLIDFTSREPSLEEFFLAHYRAGTAAADDRG
ncbi:MAG: ABC transporter ATP-binding protein [Candidatus Dormibacteria bacterium]|jgi:ABC-2 type transport system ATP-binding protein